MSKDFSLGGFIATYNGEKPDRDAWILVDSVRFLPNPDDRAAVEVIVSKFNLECPINYELREGGAHKGLVPFAIKETLKAWPNVIRNMQHLASQLNFSKLALELSQMSLEQVNLEAMESMPAIGVIVPLKPATPLNLSSALIGGEARKAFKLEESTAHPEHTFFVLNT